MIQKILILSDNRLISSKFYITRNEKKVTITAINSTESIIKVPVYNKINGIDYVPICFPLEFIIMESYVFNPHIIISSYNLDIENEIDFFYQLNTILIDNFKLSFIHYNELKDKIIPILNTYSYYFSSENFQNTDMNVLIKDFWFSVNIIKLYVIFILTNFTDICNKNIKEIHKKYNIPKQILTIANHLKSFRYNLTLNNNETKMTLIEYMLFFNKKQNLKLAEININSSYYIIVRKSDNNTTEIINTQETLDKVIKINVNKINNNIITIDSKDIIFENYLWYHYHPNTKINTAKQLKKKAVINPGCQSVCQLLLEAKLNN
jgi:hypothetical protein